MNVLSATSLNEPRILASFRFSDIDYIQDTGVFKSWLPYCNTFFDGRREYRVDTWPKYVYLLLSDGQLVYRYGESDVYIAR